MIFLLKELGEIFVRNFSNNFFFDNFAFTF